MTGSASGQPADLRTEASALDINLLSSRDYNIVILLCTVRPGQGEKLDKTVIMRRD